MPSIPAGSDKGRYIIRSRDDAKPLAEFLSSVDDDPAIDLVDTIGPQGQPHTVVVEMSHEKALSLEQRFRNTNQLVIEPDRPLSLFK
jgi:hypothetical protein